MFFQRVNERLSKNNSFIPETALSGKYLEKDIIRRYMRSKNLFLSLYKFELIANNQMIIDEVTYNNFLKDVNERI